MAIHVQKDELHTVLRVSVSCTCWDLPAACHGEAMNWVIDCDNVKNENAIHDDVISGGFLHILHNRNDQVM